MSILGLDVGTTGGKVSGVFRDCGEGIDAAVKLGREFTARPEEIRKYLDKFAEYRELYDVLKKFNHRISSS